MPPERNVRRRLMLISVGVIGMMQAGVAPAQDASTYYTVMHPDEFEIDWTSFYREAEQQTADLRAELPHHLDLAYGEDPAGIAAGQKAKDFRPQPVCLLIDIRPVAADGTFPAPCADRTLISRTQIILLRLMQRSSLG
jgi:hypothetical protein